jgi:dipeptidyl aminopeptidase/acylaminoacyl peptidase
MKQKLLFLSFLFYAIVSVAQSQKGSKSSLTIETIMQDPAKWVGTAPEDMYWGEQGKRIYFEWNPDQDTLASLYSCSVRDKEISKVTLEQQQKLPARSGNYNADKTKKVYVRNGNLFILDLKKGEERQLTDWYLQATSPDFALDETHISFLLDQNLFLLNQKNGYIRQVTNITSGMERPGHRGGAGSRATEQDQWLEEQQKELFQVLNEREAMSKARQRQRDAERGEEPLEISLGNKFLAGASLSPSGNYVVYMAGQRPEGEKSTSIPHFVTGSGYTEERNARAKVGGSQMEVEMGIFDVKNNEQVEIRKSDIPGLKELPDYLQDYPERMPKDSSEIREREVSFVGLAWHEENDLALVTVLSQDNKDRWIMLLDPSDGHLELLDRQRDEAWIGGPGISSWGLSPGGVGWMPDGKSVWFHSEESGYSHLYTVHTETKEKKALTQGEFEVSEAFISNDKKCFYFTDNRKHPGVTHFYRMPVWGGEVTQITSLEGGNEVTLSPDEKYLAIRYSYANQPWELYLQENKPGAEAVQLTTSTTDAFEAYNWRIPEFITFEAGDGAEVHARLYRPEDPEEQGPAVIFVHGAGYLQNAHKGWSSYFREYMFHNFLVDNGYTVLDMDYRGSAGYGRDWRTGIYRHMGGKDLTDQVDGAKMLAEKYNIDPERIGLYGGSYGGFITLMALFKYPEVFKAGAGLRSVTDWAHYNHGYTANILNTPVEDSLAYVRSSPIYFAEGLEGALLMCHGMVDDNVHFQDIVRLTQRLIELGKENWELAVYPLEAHAFTEPSSWTDEYKRIFKLFEENLK